MFAIEKYVDEIVSEIKGKSCSYNNSLVNSEAILKLNDLDKKNLILSVCKSSNTGK